MGVRGAEACKITYHSALLSWPARPCCCQVYEGAPDDYVEGSPSCSISEWETSQTMVLQAKWVRGPSGPWGGYTSSSGPHIWSHMPMCGLASHKWPPPCLQAYSFPPVEATRMGKAKTAMQVRPAYL